MGISFWQLLIILVIVLLLFGTKKLRSIGGDLGGAVKGFRNAMDKDDGTDTAGKDKEKIESSEGKRVIEGEVTSEEKDKV